MAKSPRGRSRGSPENRKAQKGALPASPVSRALMKGMRIAAFPSSFRGPPRRAPRWSGVEMFPDLARDDVFRLETARLWLRWPRAADAAAIERYCSRWEVAAAHRPHSPSLSGGLRRALHLRRARRQRVGTRPDPGAHPAARHARSARRDQPRRPRPGAPHARLCAGARGLGQGSGERGGRGDHRRPASA